jgi:hypothetical protein
MVAREAWLLGGGGGTIAPNNVGVLGLIHLIIIR